MNRNTHSRGVIRPQASARRPIISSGSGNTGQNAYAREQSFQRQAEMQAQRDHAAGFSKSFAVDSHDDQDIEDDDVIDITEEILSQPAIEQSQNRYRYRLVSRNASLIFSHRQTSVYKFGDIDLKPGICVELHELLGNWEAKFVEVKSIWVSRSDGSVIIRGLPYTRNRNMRGLLQKQRNEVCQILEIDSDDKRPNEAQALVGISPQQILQVRALKKTNTKHPQNCFGGDRQWSGRTDKEREEQAPLTCRRRFRVQYQDCRFRKHDKPNDQAFVNLTEAEVDGGRFRKSDKELRFIWLGRKHRGGSYLPHVIHLEGPEVPMTRKDRQYIFADMFCGAGGTSRGAVLAGLKLAFGVDHWPRACATWRRNFPGAYMYELDMTDFINKCDIDYRSHPVDILHLSPPCQEWSPQKYSNAERVNENNMASLFACPSLVEKLHTRLFTLEQTFGLLHDAHAGFFSALIHEFTRHGYSVRWKIVPLVEYGLPQTRKRLIMIGACPGEELPPWPPATHAQRPTGSQKPYVTEAQALQDISHRDPLHDVAHAIVRNNQPRNGNVPFSKTITGGGAQGVSHFSGLRDHTLREIACLQGFPVSHQFEGNRTEIKKQIGNAFPSCVAKAFYDHLRAWLQQVDGIQRVPTQIEARRDPAPRPTGPLAVHPRGLSTETRKYVNGDFNEDEALELALQESRLESLLPTIEVSDYEGQLHSPVSAVSPLLERMSIAPLEHGAAVPSGPGNRSRTATLDFSPRPSPGPSHHAATASQKRTLDSMHDGEADEVMKEESPPKRERVVDDGDHDKGVVVYDRKIPSRLPRYAGPPRPYDASGEDIAAGQPDRRNHDSVLKKSHTNSSSRGDRGSRGNTVVNDVAPSEEDGEEDVWTF